MWPNHCMKKRAEILFLAHLQPHFLRHISVLIFSSPVQMYVTVQDGWMDDLPFYVLFNIWMIRG